MTDCNKSGKHGNSFMDETSFQSLEYVDSWGENKCGANSKIHGPA